jgi:hypothetical protein
MDIYCPVCGEPWDMDSLHDVPDTNYATARRRFGRDGCAVFDTSHNSPIDAERAELSSVLFELLGDDVDGIASLMAD